MDVHKGGGGGPKSTLREFHQYLHGKDFNSEDTDYVAWIVLDCDERQCNDAQVKELCDWKKDNPEQNKIAVTKPEFEYWLLLHFEDGKKDLHKKQPIKELGKHLNGYEKKSKNLNEHQTKLLMNKVNTAIDNANKRPQFQEWPTQLGCTNAHKLVEELLEE